MEPNDTLDYAPGLELRHPIMSMIGGHGRKLNGEIERYIDREIEGFDVKELEQNGMVFF